MVATNNTLEWDEVVSKAVSTYMDTKHTTLGMSPREAWNKSRPPQVTNDKQLMIRVQGESLLFQQQLQARQQAAAQRNTRKYANRKKMQELQVGDEVFVAKVKKNRAKRPITEPLFPSKAIVTHVSNTRVVVRVEWLTIGPDGEEEGTTPSTWYSVSRMKLHKKAGNE